MSVITRVVAITAGLASLVLAVPAATADSATGRVKHAFDAFQDAPPPGRVLFTNGDVSCFAMPGKGAMGEHYVDGALVGDGQIHALAPEALIYEPQADGSRRLVGVEYLVFKADWDAKHKNPPVLFGHTFDNVKAPNMFGLPPNYSLHVWLWRQNPLGKFRPWNSRVHCPPMDMLGG